MVGGSWQGPLRHWPGLQTPQIPVQSTIQGMWRNNQQNAGRNVHLRRPRGAPEDPLRKGPCSGPHRDKVRILKYHFLSFSILDLTASFLINEIFGDVNSRSKFSSLGTDDFCAPDTGGNFVMTKFKKKNQNIGPWLFLINFVWNSFKFANEVKHESN